MSKTSSSFAIHFLKLLDEFKKQEVFTCTIQLNLKCKHNKKIFEASSYLKMQNDFLTG